MSERLLRFRNLYIRCESQYSNSIHNKLWLASFPMPANRRIVVDAVVIRAYSRATTRVEVSPEVRMTNKKRDVYRSSETGRWVTERYADTHQRTTEHEKVPAPTKKKK